MISAERRSVRKKYFRLRTVIANATGRFDSMKLWKANIEDDQVRLELMSLADCVEAVAGFRYEPRLRVLSQGRTNKVSPWLKVIRHNDSKRR